MNRCKVMMDLEEKLERDHEHERRLDKAHNKIMEDLREFIDCDMWDYVDGERMVDALMEAYYGDPCPFKYIVNEGMCAKAEAMVKKCLVS